eukprot:365900-Chlamydomonas_euryale.AAC.13
MASTGVPCLAAAPTQGLSGICNEVGRAHGSPGDTADRKVAPATRQMTTLQVEHGSKKHED